MGIWRESFCWVMIVIGRDLDGSDLIRFLMLSNGLRFFSLATAWSRPRSRIHLTSLSLTAGSVTVQRRISAGRLRSLFIENEYVELRVLPGFYGFNCLFTLLKLSRTKLSWAEGSPLSLPPTPHSFLPPTKIISPL